MKLSKFFDLYTYRVNEVLRLVIYMLESMQVCHDEYLYFIKEINILRLIFHN